MTEHPVNAVIPELEYKNDHGVTLLRVHDAFLRGDQVTLRPMTEDDWGLLLKWNNDPEVIRHVDHDQFRPRTLGDLQAIYRWISTHAHCFVIEVEERPIGECWLQRMNLRRIIDYFPGKRLRRIDLVIGEKDLWGRGYGTETIALLVDFGFSRESADALFATVSSENVRSLRAFEKCGFTSHAVIQEENGAVNYDLVLAAGSPDALG